MAVHLITLSALILVVLLVRAIFRKHVSSRLIYALWLVVLLKLCLPVSFFEVEFPMLRTLPTEQTNIHETGAPPAETFAPVLTDAPIPQVVPFTPVIPVTPIVPQQPITPSVPTVPDPAPAEPVLPSADVPEAPPAATLAPMDWAHIAKVVWFAGAAVLAIWFAVTGILFHQKLRADRRVHTTVGHTKVYVSCAAGAPCLAGIIPAIYLTPDAANAPSQDFVIRHEYTHLRHGDHVWSVLRTLALIVYWWNPLVWAAAFVSKQDAELACDEAVAAKMDDATRLAYANTILDTVPQKYVRAVGLASAPLKERILMLTGRHKNRVAAVVLAVVITVTAVGCSFIDPKVTTAPVEDDSPDPPSSSTTTAAPDDTPDAPDDSASPVQVLTNEGDLEIRPVYIPTDPFTYRLFKYDDTHYLCLTYDQTELAGYKEYAYDDLHVYIIDAKAGTVAADCAIEGSYYLSSVHYTDNGCILYETEEAAFHVVYENSTLTVNKTERPTYPVVSDCPIVSADGAYTVYTTMDDLIGAGTMTVCYADGSAKALLRHKNAGDVVDGKTVDMGDVERYHPIGFVDATRFVYSITGYEYSKGYGIYDLQTGANTKHLQAMSVAAVYDGKVYLTKQAGYETVSWWMCDPDGSEMTMIASVDEEDGVFTLPGKKYNYTYHFKNGVWFFFTEDDTITLYSHDFGQRLANLEYANSGHLFGNLQVHQNILTVVVPYVEETAQSPVRVLSNAGNLNVHAVALPLIHEDRLYYNVAFAYDAQYRIFLQYENNSPSPNRCHYNALYVVDVLNGKIAGEFDLDAKAGYPSITYTEQGSVIYAEIKDASDDTFLSYYALELTEQDGVFTLRETERNTDDPIVTKRFVSPNGKYVAYQTEEKRGDDGAIYVQSADGLVRCICENKTAQEVESAEVRMYSLTGFLDDKHVVYGIDGDVWEDAGIGNGRVPIGYGIYDTVTGETTEVVNNKSVVGMHDGALYCSTSMDLTSQEIWRVEIIGGAETLVASRDAADGVFVMPEWKVYRWHNSMWKTLLPTESADADIARVALYSPDFDQLLAVVEFQNPFIVEQLKTMPGRFLIGENSVTVIMPYAETPTEPGDITIHSLADWDALSFDGFFPTDGNCYELINGLVHFGGGADMSERYPELKTVTIGAYTIRRNPDEKMLHFDFAVTESGLDALPVGKYETTIEPDFGPGSDDAKMTVLTYNGAEKAAMDLPQSDAIRHLRLWFLAQRTWDVGEYGTYDVNAREFPDNYLAFYAEGRHALAEVNVWTKDLLGVILNEDDAYVKRNSNEDGTISLVPGYGGGSMIYDIVDVQIGEEADTITVQHYNEVNRLIQSVKVAYKIGHAGRIYGCELLEDSKYAPFGMLSESAYTYKEWKPIE